MHRFHRTIIAGLMVLAMLYGTSVAAADYVNTVSLTAATAGSSIEYFYKNGLGSTTVADSAQFVRCLTAQNTSTVTVTMLVYQKTRPGSRDLTFDEAFGFDFTSYTIHPNTTLIIDGGFTIWGWRNLTTPTGGTVELIGSEAAR